MADEAKRTGLESWLRLIVATTIATTLVLAAALPARADKQLAKCLIKTGKVGEKCLVSASKELAGVYAPAADALDGLLDASDVAADAAVVASCTLTDVQALGYVSEADVALRSRQACGDFAYEANGIVLAVDPAGLSDGQRKCGKLVEKLLLKVRKVTTVAWKKCVVAGYKDKPCDRVKRDAKIDKLRAKAAGVIENKCGADFDALGTFEGATLTERVATFVGLAVTRGSHYAQRVYPPELLAPLSEFGPFPIGVTTLALADASRLDVPGTGPRPVTTEVYYPSTTAAVDGVPRDIVNILGFDIVETPAYRDVDLAAGNYPLILFSHGNNGIRVQSFFFAAHLASYGYIVVTPDHHGNTFVDSLVSIVDPASAVNRPLDMSFLIDEFTTFSASGGNFFEGAIDTAAIGASGHSFGGFTAFSLAGGATEDTRVKAILPQAPAAPFADAFFAGITVPTLILGGSIDETTPFATDQQHPFDQMVAGASVVGLIEFINGGHFTFSDFCEVPDDILGFLGGAEEACEPRHLSWRWAHDIVTYASLNFFDAVLKGDGAAQSRIDDFLTASPLADMRAESK